ncbi:flagellar hook-basal body complex protein FliE [Halobacteriovorax sp. GFR7]|uniref:flagellar hook-basal body complex protein FliE n=1 Tax=Bacteriovoracales TaxID=2024979 RepID=UPI0003854A87|nr:flagellar hook-basal body complex protein FliE [Bacteriovorax sp. BAL6_X]EPZ51823.1 flagellar hook-basal body complex protein FliE [Bacteriovorax sp. BAL6_X]
MAINNITTMNDVFNSHKMREWTSPTGGAEEFKLEGFDELSKVTPSERSQSFSEMLSNQIMDVNNLQKEANTAIEKLVSGESKNIHETMLAVERAEIAFKTMNQVRNKVIDAYKEVMRMQV